MCLFQWMKNNPSEIILLVTAIILAITTIYTGLQRKSTKTAASIQLLHDLLNLHRLPEMRGCYENLWHFFEVDCEGLKEKVKSAYKSYKKDKDQNRTPSFKTFDYQRAYLSHFYQMLAIYHDEKLIKDKLIFETWNENNLKILDVIIPIEESIEGYSKKTIDRLNKLYKDSKKYS